MRCTFKHLYAIFNSVERLLLRHHSPVPGCSLWFISRLIAIEAWSSKTNLCSTTLESILDWVDCFLFVLGGVVWCQELINGNEMFGK